MKTIFFILLTVFIFSIENSYSQFFHTPVRLTNGNNDRNPCFNTSNAQMCFSAYIWEFLAFERVTGTSSQICVTKIGNEGAIDSAYYITNDVYLNQNPSLAYKFPPWGVEAIKYALIIWETNRNGNWDVYGSRYRESLGWSQPFVIDASTGNQKNAKVVCIDSTNFAIAYQYNNDIMFRKYNLLTNSFSLDTNLTLQESQDCGNPLINRTNYVSNPWLIVTYERAINSTRNAIYYRQTPLSSNPLAWSAPDTITYIGNNRNSSISSSVYYPSNLAFCLFESDRSGTWNIFGTVITTSNTQYKVLENEPYENYNYVGKEYEITDNYSHHIYGYLRKNINGIKVVFKNVHTSPPNDTVTVNISSDSSYISKLTMNYGIFHSPAFHRVWIAYNKDSSLHSQYPSRIYGNYFVFTFTSVKPINNTAPDKFKLHQNYPNPFNPVTNIRFDIPSSSQVKLIIYDALGREVATLVNEKLSAGSYETSWDGSGYPSGVYFCQLKTDEFIDIRKMILSK